MVLIEKPINIISGDFTLNDGLDLEKGLSGNLIIQVADSLTSDSVVDVMIGDKSLGWLTLESAIDLAKGIIDEITPLVKCVQKDSDKQ